MSGPKPKLLLFPGIDGVPELRRGLMECLEDRFEAQIFSLPEDPDLDYEGLSQWLAERLPEGPLVLAGESFSGPLVAMIAEKRPDKVKGVVFIASFPKLGLLRAAVHLLPFIPLRAIPFAPISWLLMGQTGSEDIRREMHKALKLLTPKIAKHRAKLALDVDVRQIITGLPQAILVIHGTRDRLLPYRYVRQFQELRPDAQIVPIDGYHMILETHPKPIAKALEVFMESLFLSS
ncbi:alpha/beta fold hydrolase [Microvirga lotononidis]|uniref:Putative hydrolase or acyltransferase of alpha/beta superfamily n=1 Tax=Microvirga lotononidis TaxID=864069 RepID=I4YX00_9HYPH|nr:alpha/beta fold hydrolase [Microvirga lotononidis]EIM28492.1 putative hydrolase or acyltransferase of alpha/beta superfamily [Microvirga lotononidis]WQO27435.1 alpha/beta fold hydrolase [Microvirga lotononidis]